MSNGKQSGKSQFSISQPPTDMLSQLKMHEMVKCSKILKKGGTLSQGPRSPRKCAGAKGGTIFWGNFLLHFCAIWKNDPFSKSENVPGLKPRLPRRLRGPWWYIFVCKLSKNYLQLPQLALFSEHLMILFVLLFVCLEIVLWLIVYSVRSSKWYIYLEIPWDILRLF